MAAEGAAELTGIGVESQPARESARLQQQPLQTSFAWGDYNSAGARRLVVSDCPCVIAVWTGSVKEIVVPRPSSGRLGADASMWCKYDLLQMAKPSPSPWELVDPQGKTWKNFVERRAPASVG